jgi:hypothetical protein
MAYPSVPGNFYSHVHVHGDARAQLGNSYSYGPTEDQQILQSILQSLYYPEMGQRGSDVPDAGTNTFKWLFKDGKRQPLHDSDESDEYEQENVDDERRSEEEETHDQEASEGELSDLESTYSEDQSERDDIAAKLRSWLKDDGGSVFWVTGKPGSGKSTFMKFLRDHEETSALLQDWAQDDLLIVADHFFWLPGTQLQRSFEGLARSLLHAILSSLAGDLTYAKTICAKRRWSLNTSHRPWSQSEFKRMFRTLGGLRGIRVCLLVDGLDECCPQQKHDDLMDDLLDIVRLPNIKACLSSRPWSEFATRLGRGPSLRLDQITYFDMITYVTNRIYQVTREQPLMAKEIRKLVGLVVGRADGVFLWVELVVRAVNVELKKGRGMSRVSSIVHELPSGLDDYFATLIYERIEKTNGNISDTASVLSLAMQLEERPHDNGNLPFIDYWLLSRGALGHVLELPKHDAPRDDRTSIIVMMRQTRTFLELASKDLLVLSHENVRFLHRTVYDFLKSGRVNNAIYQGSPAHFQQTDFLSKVVRLRYIHAMMAPDLLCGDVDRILAAVAQLLGADANVRIFATACESLAIDHLHNVKSCLGSVAESTGSWSSGKHQIRLFMAGPKKLRTYWVPHGYIRELFRHWPTTIHTMLTGEYRDYTRISDLRLRDLCSACTDIMNGCIYNGAIPDDWTMQLVPQEDFEPIKGRHLESDDGPQHYICEFCRVDLPYSRDYGLKDTFFLFEKIALESFLPKTGRLALNLLENPSSERKIAKSLSFELPWSILRRANGLQALSATAQFQQFVWYRQKLRAVRSLLTTIRRHLSEFIIDRPFLYSREMQEVWLSFIHEFIEPPAKRYIRGWYRLQCDCCSKNFEPDKSVVVFLRPNKFPLFCEDCYRRTAPQRDLGFSFVCTIPLEYNYNLSLNQAMIDRAVIKAVLEIVAWYSATAPAYGLGHTMPSDTTEIQRELLAISETEQRSSNGLSD